PRARRPALRAPARGRVLWIRRDLPFERQCQVGARACLLRVAPPAPPGRALDADPRRPGPRGHRSRPRAGGLRGDGPRSERRVVALRPTRRLRARYGPADGRSERAQDCPGAGVFLEHGFRDLAPRGHRRPSARRASPEIAFVACRSPATTSANRWSAPAMSVGTPSVGTTRTPTR